MRRLFVPERKTLHEHLCELGFNSRFCSKDELSDILDEYGWNPNAVIEENSPYKKIFQIYIAALEPNTDSGCQLKDGDYAVYSDRTSDSGKRFPRRLIEMGFFDFLKWEVMRGQHEEHPKLIEKGFRYVDVYLLQEYEKMKDTVLKLLENSGQDIYAVSGFSPVGPTGKLYKKVYYQWDIYCYPYATLPRVTRESVDVTLLPRTADVTAPSDKALPRAVGN